jgi:hypothetical protein
VVEGGSDVAACESHNLCAVGRASNTYGGEWIRKMIRQCCPDKLIVVVGERDEQPKQTRHGFQLYFELPWVQLLFSRVVRHEEGYSGTRWAGGWRDGSSGNEGHERVVDRWTVLA